MQPWLADDRDRRPGGARRSSRRTRSGPSSRSGADRCAGRRCPFVSTCFAEARARPRRRGRARDREPRALLRRPRRRGRRAARARRGHLRRGAPARGVGRRVARRPRLAGRAAAARRRRRARLPRGASRSPAARQLDRVERAGERLLRAVAPPGGRRRLREIAGRAGARAGRRARRARRRARRAAARSSTRSRGARSASPRRSRRCLEPERARAASSGPSPTRSRGRRSTSSQELRERLWDDGPTAILVSATLTTGEDAGVRPPPPRARRARARRSSARRTTSASRRCSTCRARCPTRARDGFTRARRRRDRARCSRSREGRALVLTSSYRALDAYRERVRGRVPYDVLVQGEAPRERLLERFRDEVDSVLLATSTFWQGVDVPGESLSLLVIDKLPFSAPGDPLHEARCEAVERDGRRLVPRLRAADGDAPAAPGLRAADPRPRRPRRGRDPRSAAAHARRTAGRSSRRCPLPASSTTAAAVAAFFGDTGGRIRLNGRPRWRKKKPKTPPPPRARPGAEAARRTSRASRRRPGRRHRTMLYGVAGIGVVGADRRRRCSSRSAAASSAARRASPPLMTTAGCNFKTVAAYVPPGQGVHVASLTKKLPWNTDPPSNGQHYPALGGLGLLHRAGQPEHGRAQRGARRRDPLVGDEGPGADRRPAARLLRRADRRLVRHAVPEARQQGRDQRVDRRPGEVRQEQLLRPGPPRDLPALRRARRKKAFEAFRNAYRGHGPEGIPLSLAKPGMGPQ